MEQARRMGADKSRYEPGQFNHLPVTGLNPENGLFVIFTPDNRYIRPSETVLILKEKQMAWTGDDCVIKDTHQQKGLIYQAQHIRLLTSVY